MERVESLSESLQRYAAVCPVCSVTLQSHLATFLRSHDARAPYNKKVKRNMSGPCQIQEICTKRCSIASLLASLSLIELFIPRGCSSAIYSRFFLANSLSTHHSQNNSETIQSQGLVRTNIQWKHIKTTLNRTYITVTETQPQPHSHSALVLAFHCPVLLGRVGAKDLVQSERKALLSTPWARRHPLKLLLTPTQTPLQRSAESPFDFEGLRLAVQAKQQNGWRRSAPQHACVMLLAWPNIFFTYWA